MNKKIAVAAFIIVGSGVVNALLHGGRFTPVFIGGFVFVVVLSIVDFFGGPLAQFSSALAMIAVVYILLAQFPWADILKAIGSTGKTGGSGGAKFGTQKG